MYACSFSHDLQFIQFECTVGVKIKEQLGWELQGGLDFNHRVNLLVHAMSTGKTLQIASQYSEVGYNEDSHNEDS